MWRVMSTLFEIPFETTLIKVEEEPTFLEILPLENTNCSVLASKVTLDVPEELTIVTI